VSREPTELKKRIGLKPSRPKTYPSPQPTSLVGKLRHHVIGIQPFNRGKVTHGVPVLTGFLILPTATEMHNAKNLLVVHNPEITKKFEHWATTTIRVRGDFLISLLSPCIGVLSTLQKCESSIPYRWRFVCWRSSVVVHPD